MSISLLITGGSAKKRLAKIKSIINQPLIEKPDLLIFNPDPTITIKQVRSIEKFLSFKPVSLDSKYCVLNKAHLLTLPAQHAILKILEEPPVSAQIILTCPHQDQLLPTIVSRCQLINLKPIKLSQKTIDKQFKLYQKISNAGLGDRILLIKDHTKDSTTAKKFIRLQTKALRAKLLKKPTPNLTQTLKHLHLAFQQINTNVNPKLVLESLVLNY